MLRKREKVLETTRQLVINLKYALSKVDKEADRDKVLDENKPVFDILKQLRELTEKKEEDNVIPEKELAEFTAWFTKNGGKLYKVKPQGGLPEGTGMVATEDIAKDEPIIEVPYKIMMTIETAAKCPSHVALGQAAEIFPEVELGLQVMYEKFNITSFWAPYIKVLPKHFSTPLFWEWEDFVRLKGSPTLDDCMSSLRISASQFCHIFQLMDRASGPAAPERFISIYNFTYYEYAWAMSVIMTRKNRVPRKLKQELVLPNGHEPETDMIALIPMWDMLNHREGEITTFATDKGSRCQAMLDFKAGTQVYMYYGDRPNTQLLSHNGFVIEDGSNSAHDMLVVKPPPIPSDGDRFRVAKETTLWMPPSGLGYFISGNGDPSPGLIGLLRALMMTDEEIAAYLADPKHPDLKETVLNEENEKKARKKLAEVCIRALAKYPTTIGDDKTFLTTGEFAKLSPVSRAITVEVIFEKLMLRAAAGLSRVDVKIPKPPTPKKKAAPQKQNPQQQQPQPQQKKQQQQKPQQKKKGGNKGKK